MVTHKRTVAIVLTLLMVAAAGCAGWGADGPANDQQENQTQDPSQGEETNAGAQGDDGDSSGATSNGSGTGNGSSTDRDDGADSDSGDTGSESGDGGNETGSNDDSSVSNPAESQDTASEDTDTDTASGSSNDGDGGNNNTDAGDGTGNENETDDDNEPETHTLTVRTPGAPDGTAITVQREANPGENQPDPITKASAGSQASFNVSPGYYHVEAERYNSTMVAIEVSDDTEITLQQPGPDPIQVTVVDAETDEPIEGAEISGLCHLWYSSGDAYVTGTTDANGVAQAQADVAPTECNASVEADGYERTQLSLSVPDDDGITVELSPASADDDGNSTATENETAAQVMTP